MPDAYFFIHFFLIFYYVFHYLSFTFFSTSIQYYTIFVHTGARRQTTYRRRPLRHRWPERTTKSSPLTPSRPTWASTKTTTSRCLPRPPRGKSASWRRWASRRVPAAVSGSALHRRSTSRELYFYSFFPSFYPLDSSFSIVYLLLGIKYK